jgi:hypothetical protein
VFAVARRVELQHVSLVAGLGLAVAAVFWLSSSQNASGPASMPALTPAPATSTETETEPQVAVYLVESQAAADDTWAREREAEWIRFDNGITLLRQIVVFVAETSAQQAAIREAYTGREVTELGREIIFFDLIEANGGAARLETPVGD